MQRFILKIILLILWSVTLSCNSEGLEHYSKITGVIRDRIVVDGQPFKSWFVNDDKTLVVVSSNGNVSFINLESYETDVLSTETYAVFSGVITKNQELLLTWSYYHNTISIISIPRRKLLKTVTFGKNIGQIHLRESDGKAIITAVGSKQIGLLNLESFQIEAEATLQYAIGHIDISEDQKWMACSSGVYRSQKRIGRELLAISLELDNFGTVLQQRALPIGFYPRGIEIIHDSGETIVAEKDNSQVLHTNILLPYDTITYVDTGRQPESVLSLSDNNWLVLNRDESILTFLEFSQNNQVNVKNKLLSGRPWSILYDSSKSYAFLTYPGRKVVSRRYFGGPKVYHGRESNTGDVLDSVGIFDISLEQEIDVIQTDKGPIDISLSNRGDKLAVSCAESKTINIIY